MLVGAMPPCRKVTTFGARSPEGSVADMGGVGGGDLRALSSLPPDLCASTSATGWQGRGEGGRGTGKGEIHVRMDRRLQLCHRLMLDNERCVR